MVKKLSILLVSLIPVSVMAEMHVVEDAAKMVDPASSSTAAQPVAAKNPVEMRLVSLTYIGAPDADIPVISGFGRDLKLLDAIKQIVPAGWAVFLKDDFVSKTNQSVSWRGGRRWVEVLDILANEQGITVTVDWTKRSLYVVERVVVETNHSKKNDAKITSWTLKEGHTIGREIQTWAKSAGWKVVWNLGKDWSVPASTTFTGDFKSAATEVIKTLSANGVLIRAQFYDGNKTMVVTGPGVAEQ